MVSIIALIAAICLLLCAVYYLPSPPLPAHIKPVAYVLIFVGAAVAVWSRWG